jgi:hypothetical protein
MGGHRQPRSSAALGLDKSGRYRDACDQLSDARGFQREYTYSHWCLFAMIRKAEQGWPQSVCEWAAWRDVLGCFDKAGQRGD